MAKGKAAEIVLSVEERRELESLARRRSTGKAWRSVPASCLRRLTEATTG